MVKSSQVPSSVNEGGESIGSSIFDELLKNIQTATKAGVILLISAVSTNAMASEVSHPKIASQGIAVEYKSEIGIDYLKLTSGDKELANILLKGEIEFFNNIDKVIEYKGGGKRYKSKKRQIRRWTSIAESIGKGELNENQLDILRIGAMKFILSFSTLENKKYPLLHIIGENQAETNLYEALK